MRCKKCRKICEGFARKCQCDWSQWTPEIEVYNEQKEKRDPYEITIGQTLTEDQMEQLTNFLYEYHDLFAWTKDDLGRTNMTEHAIQLEDPKPVKTNPRITGPKQKEFIDKELERMQRLELIRKSYSEWASPIVLVKKKDGGLRFCVDYRELNKQTRKDSYPLPKIKEMLDTLNGAQWFSTLDLASGFWQVPIRPEDVHKTAFTTFRGTFEFLTMPFGLCNAPATFQRLMDKVLRDYVWQSVVVYMDDVNVFSKSWKDHLDHLRNVFECIKKAGLKLNPEKCKFGSEELKFLGHIIKKEGIQMDPEKLEAVSNFPIPKNLTQLKSFLGLTGWYRMFVKNYAVRTAPMRELCKKDATFRWGSRQQKAFEDLKHCMTSEPIVLAYPDFSKPFILHTDASKYGLGAMLTQKDDREREQVIAYGARATTRSEQNYGITELECLAVKWAIKRYHHYLWGSKFRVITDHSALVYLRNMKDPTGMFARWLAFLENYEFDVLHRKGKEHKAVDALSRIQHDYWNR